MFEESTRFIEAWTGKKLICVCRDGTVDWDSLNSTIHHDEYGFKDFDFKGDEIIIDVGAETGGEAMVLSSLIPDGQIYSYEPLPENYELLKKHIKLNCLKNVSPFLNSVGGSNRIERIYYGDEKTESGRRHKFIGNAFNVPQNGYVESDMITLENIFQILKLQKVFILKLDCEGAEPEILQNTPNYILNKIDFIVGEHHFHTRAELLKMTKGIFTDESCPYQAQRNIGHFRFKNKRLK